MRRVAEWLLRLAAFCGAMALVRWGYVTYAKAQEHFSSAFEFDWAGWAQWVALLAVAGFVLGLACTTVRPGGYRLQVPLAVTLPAVLMLGHFRLLFASLDEDGSDLPWILGDPMFYMDLHVQFVLAVAAGLGLAAGLQPRAAPEPEPDTEVEDHS
jgi:hypothetical protein